MAKGIACPACKGTRVWAKGYTPTRTGKKARYICFACGKTFYKVKAEPKPRVKKSKSTKK